MLIQWLKSYAFGEKRNIPSLDGLRAISVSLVLFSHLCGSRNFPLGETSYPVSLGIVGVRVFFIISGYLITSALLRELAKTGTIDLPRFYFRRGLRLFPAAWVFITIAAILGSAGLLALHKYDLLFAYTYTSNYFDGRSPAIGHLWSLAVEEQFYLLWPIGLKLMGRSRARSFLIVLICLAPLFRILSLKLSPAMNFLMCSDSLGVGCLLAIAEPELLVNDKFQRFLRSPWMAAVPLVALAANSIPSTKVSWLVGETIQNVGFAICVFWSVKNPASRVGRFLNLPLISLVGVLSYSLYLWQQLFTRFGILETAVFPLNLGLMFTFALLSYLFVEGPFLRLRTWLEPRLFPAKPPVARVTV
jgi:peptidoglycan/LPS O-acetylase OafA/YrhL